MALSDCYTNLDGSSFAAMQLLTTDCTRDAHLLCVATPKL
jgi:hypothetical protein